MNSSFLPKYEQKQDFCPHYIQGKNPDNFLFVFWENDDFINSFWK